MCSVRLCWAPPCPIRMVALRPFLDDADFRLPEDSGDEVVAGVEFKPSLGDASTRTLIENAHSI